MKKRVLLLLTIPMFSLFAQTGTEFEKMAFLIGDWELHAKSLMPDGTYQPHIFRSKVEYIFQGSAI